MMPDGIPLMLLHNTVCIYYSIHYWLIVHYIDDFSRLWQISKCTLWHLVVVIFPLPIHDDPCCPKAVESLSAG